MKRLTLLFLIIVLSGCSSVNNSQNAATESPAPDVEKYAYWNEDNNIDWYFNTKYPNLLNDILTSIENGDVEMLDEITFDTGATAQIFTNDDGNNDFQFVIVEERDGQVFYQIMLTHQFETNPYNEDNTITEEFEKFNGFGSFNLTLGDNYSEHLQWLDKDNVIHSDMTTEPYMPMYCITTLKTDVEWNDEPLLCNDQQAQLILDARPEIANSVIENLKAIGVTLTN